GAEGCEEACRRRTCARRAPSGVRGKLGQGAGEVAQEAGGGEDRILGRGPWIAEIDLFRGSERHGAGSDSAAEQGEGRDEEEGAGLRGKLDGGVSNPNERRISPPNLVLARPGQRVAIVKGQDGSRWTDFYHLVLTATWLEFFGGLFVFFVGLNL